MEKISVLGLGRMGSALAAALVRAGYRVTVWNRSPAADLGASVASTPAEAVAASEICITCLSTYDVQSDVLDGAGVPPALISLTSGKPAQARAAAKWAADKGIVYVDGALLAVPQMIGTPAARVLSAGTSGYSGVLRVFGEVVHLGEDAGLAAQATSGDYRTDVSSLDINAEGLRLLEEASRSAGIGVAVPSALRELFDRAVASGHGAESVASIVEEIRKP